jgi:hypothetical protein
MDLSISHTAKTTFMQCPRKYWYRYTKRLEQKLTPKPFRMGSAFSRGLEEWSPSAALDWYEDYWTEHPAERFAGQKLESQVVRLMVEAYRVRYDPTDREIELNEITIGHGTFRGYIDGVKSSLVLIEDKFKSQWTPADEAALELDDQLAGYAHAYAAQYDCDIDDLLVQYRVTRKPALRQRKDEMDEAFLARIRADVFSRMDHYFKEIPVPMSKQNVDVWLEDTGFTSMLMHQCETFNQWPMNRSSCKSYGSLCSFFALCSARDELEAEAVLQDNYIVREIREH